MDFVVIIGLIGTVANIVTKAIPFVEELFSGKDNAGAAKSAIVMNMAQVAFSGVEGAIIKNNPNWAVLEPLVQNFINDSIAAIKKIQEAEKAG